MNGEGSGGENEKIIQERWEKRGKKKKEKKRVKRRGETEYLVLNFCQE